MISEPASRPVWASVSSKVSPSTHHRLLPEQHPVSLTPGQHSKDWPPSPTELKLPLPHPAPLELRSLKGFGSGLRPALLAL